MQEDLALKILVVGEPFVGKTSLVQRYTQGSFSNNYKSTIGVDFSTRNILWTENLNLSLNFWDLAGQSRLNTQIKAYYRKTHGVICVCDIIRPETTEEVTSWRNLIFENCVTEDGTQTFPPIILLVNKMDLVKENLDERMEIFKAAAERIGAITYLSISVKDNDGIDDAVKALLLEILKRKNEHGDLIPADKAPGTIHLENLPPERKTCC
jgi:small GTP-binding protein